MRKDRIKYKQVTELPKGAVPVKTYAERENVSVTWVYKLFKHGKLKIVDHYGKNYVFSSRSSALRPLWLNKH